MEIAWEGGESAPVIAEKLRLKGEACNDGVEATMLIWNVLAGACPPKLSVTPTVNESVPTADWAGVPLRKPLTSRRSPGGTVPLVENR